jgi:hypothetical protein
MLSERANGKELLQVVEEELSTARLAEMAQKQLGSDPQRPLPGFPFPLPFWHNTQFFSPIRSPIVSINTSPPTFLSLLVLSPSRLSRSLVFPQSQSYSTLPLRASCLLLQPTKRPSYPSDTHGEEWEGSEAARGLHLRQDVGSRKHGQGQARDACPNTCKGQHCYRLRLGPVPLVLRSTDHKLVVCLGRYQNHPPNTRILSPQPSRIQAYSCSRRLPPPRPSPSNRVLYPKSHRPRTLERGPDRTRGRHLDHPPSSLHLRHDRDAYPHQPLLHDHRVRERRADARLHHQSWQTEGAGREEVLEADRERVGVLP